jgi:hypothetical protein
MDTRIVVEVVMGGWLLVLTLAVLVLARQLSVVSLRLMRSDGTVDVSEDGPELGSELPVRWRELLAAPASTTLLLLSATCVTCRDVVDGLSKSSPAQPLVVLLSGGNEVAESMAQRLSPLSRVRVVRGELPAEFGADLQIKSVPFGLVVSAEGTVTSKGYVYNAASFVGALVRDEPVGAH